MWDEDVDASLSGTWRMWRWLPEESESYIETYRWSKSEVVTPYQYIYDGSSHDLMGGPDITLSNAA